MKSNIAAQILRAYYKELLDIIGTEYPNFINESVKQKVDILENLKLKYPHLKNKIETYGNIILNEII